MGRKEYKYHYTVSTCADEELFFRQCNSIERHVPRVELRLKLHDVDCTRVRFYWHPLGEIVVRNDRQVDALWVESDFDLLPFFEDGK